MVRRVTGDVEEFTSTRDAYVADLEAQDGVVADREFQPFLSFTTFAEPDPPVYIGLTEGAGAPDGQVVRRAPVHRTTKWLSGFRCTGRPGR